MAKALSFDLRRRIIAAIKSGISCRGTAERFGVSASSAIRWYAQDRKTGDARPNSFGGEQDPDITLTELQHNLTEGIGVGIGTQWPFFKRRRITLKKRPRTQRNGIVPIS
jgi:transposase